MTSVNIEHAEGLATITLDGPRLNALDVELLRELRSATSRLDNADGLVLTGTGRAFSAGVDLDRILEGGASYAHDLLQELNGAVIDLLSLDIPVVAAVNGHAIAGGCIIAMATDLRIAGEGKIGLNELQIGVPFPPAALTVAHHVLGSRAEQLIYAAELHQADEACRLGYVDEVVPAEQVMERARRRIEHLSTIPAATFQRTKSVLSAARRGRLAFDDHEAETLAGEWTSPEMLDRIARVLGR